MMVEAAITERNRPVRRQIPALPGSGADAPSSRKSDGGLRNGHAKLTREFSVLPGSGTHSLSRKSDPARLGLRVVTELNRPIRRQIPALPGSDTHLPSRKSDPGLRSVTPATLTNPSGLLI